MALIGFHASHEMFPPSALLGHVRRTERAGFTAAMCSDHFLPWHPNQGQSGYSFAWLGAALAATDLPLGTICCPYRRYRPEIVAQAAATLAEMFPGRFWLAVGTGQALNEHVTGDPWPAKPERRAHLAEAVDVIRRLWAGETVTHRGRVVTEAAGRPQGKRPAGLVGPRPARRMAPRRPGPRVRADLPLHDQRQPRPVHRHVRREGPAGPRFRDALR